MQGRFSDSTQMCATRNFDCCADEIIQVYQNSVHCLLLCAPSRFLSWMHLFLEDVMGEIDFFSMAWWMRSRPVSVAAQKYAGLSTQPICSTDGTTNSMGLPGGLDIMYAEFHLKCNSTRILQNPPRSSILESMQI